MLRDRSAWNIRLSLLGIGAIQLGLMYLFYYQSFLLLTVPEVLLFTILTPIYVTLIENGLNRRFSAWFLLSAALSVVGAGIIRFGELESSFWQGFLMVQGTNICFATGQILYRRTILKSKQNSPEYSTFGYFYVGAAIIVVPVWLFFGQPNYPTTLIQWGILLWLGIVASGLGYYLWNKGTSRVNIGALAVMNNMLIPCGLLVNLLIWNRETDLTRLTLGGLVIVGSLIFNERFIKTRSQPRSQ